MTLSHKGAKLEILDILFVCRWLVFRNPVTIINYRHEKVNVSSNVKMTPNPAYAVP